MPNRFIELVNAGRIADEAALKRAFRAAAKRIHPDLAAAPDALRDAEKAGSSFIALRADFEAAVDYLASGRRPGAVAAPAPASEAGPPPAAPDKVYAYSREAFYQALENLVGRGFPRRPRARYPAQGYDAARSLVLSYLAGRDEVYPEDKALAAFLDFESGYAALARPGSGWLSVENDPARSIYFLVSDILLFHENGFPHLAAFARNVRPDTERLLRERGEPRPLAFLALLMADLDSGPAGG